MKSKYWNKYTKKTMVKQAKIYEIDLGQNNGPYKEELLLRYGDHALNKLINKLDHNYGTSLDKQNIKHMNEILKPFQERCNEFTDENMVDICSKLEEKMYKIDMLIVELQELEDKLDSQISNMTHDLFERFEKNLNEFHPKLREKYTYLKDEIKKQKDESANFNKQIDILKQEIDILTKNLDKLQLRITNIEETTGISCDYDYVYEDNLKNIINENNYYN